MKNKITTYTINISLILIFLIFSNGLFFSIHSCIECGKKEIYIFQHPKCCNNIEHHHSKSETEHNCCENDRSHKDNHSCNTNNKYLKIFSFFNKNSIFKLIKIEKIFIKFLFKFLLLNNQERFIKLYNYYHSPPDIIYLKDFISFSNQRIYYH